MKKNMPRYNPEWNKSIALIISFIIYILVLIILISVFGTNLIHNIHSYYPFGKTTILNEIGDIIARYLEVSLVILFGMVIYDVFVYYIWFSLPEPKYRKSLKSYYLIIQTYRFINRMFYRVKLNIVHADISSNDEWFPTRNILVRKFLAKLLGVLFEILVPKGLITISAWLIVVFASFDLISTISEHLFGYYFNMFIGFINSQTNESSIVSIVIILTGVFAFIAFIIKMIYLQNRKTILKINIRETKSDLVKNALNYHYRAYRILYKNTLAIKRNMESIYRSRNRLLDAYLSSISHGDFLFDWENGESIIEQKNLVPPSDLKSIVEKYSYSFDDLNKLRVEVKDLGLVDIMERVIYQFGLPVSHHNNLFWWEDLWEKKVPNSVSMPNYIKIHEKKFEEKRKYYEPDTDEIKDYFRFTKSVIDTQIFELINFYFDQIEYLNRMSKEFGTKDKYFDGLLMSFIKVK